MEKEESRIIKKENKIKGLFGSLKLDRHISGQEFNDIVNEGWDDSLLEKQFKKSNVLKETFGTHKFSKPIKKLMSDVDKELYNI
ncbi:MAG: hypothetical protein AABX35_03920 [Nanoarchaeota archaeon]